MKKNASVRALGFDFGLKRIGVAVGSPAMGHAQPVTTLQAQHGRPDWTQIAALIEDWRPDALVVGNPNSLSDKNLMGKLKKFVRELAERFDRPVRLIDEAYSSLEARRRIKKNTQHQRCMKEEIDKIAAVLILEAWFYENADGETSDESGA